jgi:SAM-dependent methyltransferase
VPDNPYDEVPYLTRPRQETHPDRLAAVGKLFGMQTAEVPTCRVLEIGCGDGGNLVPLAYYLPGSFAVGVDLAPGLIESAQGMARDLQLSNIRLVAGDLRDIGADFGEFDFILAHGLYSWIPPDVRDALLRVCAERLAPRGIALISYNTYPGRYMRQMLREMMLYEIREIRSPQARIEQARSFLQTIGEGRLAPAAWRELLQTEAAILLQKDPGSFWHDDLAPVNDPVYLHQFVAHAARHGLQYLGDADGRYSDDEQESDFLRCRRFRETLLCREGIALDRSPTAASMRGFLFSAPARPVQDGQIEGLNGVRIAPGHPQLESIVSALGDSYPLPLPFDDLAPYGGDGLDEILFALVCSGFAGLHVHDFPCEESVTEFPRASRLVRWQAARGNVVTSACHISVQLGEDDLRLLEQLDGSRPVEDPTAMAAFAQMGLLE